MAAQTDPDFDRYERELADMFDFGRKQGASDIDTQRQTNKARSLELREEQQAAQRRREAQRDAQREAAQATQTSTVDTPQLSAPTLSVPGVASLGVGTGGPDRATSARIIVVIVVFAAIGTVAHDAIVGGPPAKTTVKVGNGTVTVPTHLRTLGAVLVMGTIALVVNEVDPGIGLLLGVALGLDVVANTFLGTNGLFGRLQNGILADKTSAPQVPAYTTVPGSVVPTPFGFNIPGPVGVASPTQVWNGKAWVQVPSTKTN